MNPTSSLRTTPRTIAAAGSSLFRRLSPSARTVAFVLIAAVSAPAWAQLRPNRLASFTLGWLDLDGNGQFDQDSDGDGLPDTWELGGLDSPDLKVPFPSPQPIVPGTPPVSLFSRLKVFTQASAADTDGDGLSDFIEVFGLKFIDDNHDGVIEDACARDTNGNVIDANGNKLFDPDGNFIAAGVPARLSYRAVLAGAQSIAVMDENGVLTFKNGAAARDAADAARVFFGSGPSDFDDALGEWFDFNHDGLPSIGEYPAPNKLCPTCQFDYDGFVFTDPTLRDTDGDGLPDGVDSDPLINPLAFGTTNFHTRNNANDFDQDDDGLGNGMDLGDDRRGVLDNPTDLRRVLEQFRRDVLNKSGRQARADRVPEGLLDDLLGADWNGDGLFRINDITRPHFGAANADPSSPLGAIDLFVIEVTKTFAGINAATISPPVSRSVKLRLFARTPFASAGFDGDQYNSAVASAGGGFSRVGVPLPYQELLKPVSATGNEFFLDPRIWTILYSWRMPGVDVDGDGFIGLDSSSFQTEFFLDDVRFDSIQESGNVPSTRILIAVASSNPTLNGVVEAPSSGPCASLSLGFGSIASITVLMSIRLRRRRFR